MLLGLLAAVVASLSSNMIEAATTFQPARPPSIPLAVRSPYLNTWLSSESGGVLPGSWPKFWTDQVTGWQGFVTVDGIAYNWMGAHPGPAKVTQTSFEYTSTKSIFTFDVDGKVTMTATFLSPVFPDDLVRQSLQFSYIDIKVKSSDGDSHKVQVYMDISGEFTSGDESKVINWDYGTWDGVAYHRIALEKQDVFTESTEKANWGTWFLSTSDKPGMTHQSGPDVDVRAQFSKSGKLDNSDDSKPRAVNDNWPVFGFAHDLGDVSDSEREVLFTIGLSQEQVINFQGEGDSKTSLDGHWKSAYGSAIEAMAAFFKDWEGARDYSGGLDERIQRDSEGAAGQDYATITTLSVRQAFGGLQVAQGPKQTYIFLKEISSNSDIQTVDVIFPAHPLFLYLNATLLKLTLDPLFENQESGHYPKNSAIHDLGTFPVAKGYPQGDDEEMPLEECGNMIIMALGYAQRSGDNGYLEAHWPKLDQWAQYLVNDSLIPAKQLSTDDFAGRLENQTNLALKGIIALKAMEEIGKRTNHEVTYGKTAEEYLQKWRGFAINNDASPPHTTLSYGDGKSHGLLYNLYADRLLGLNFVDKDIYEMQSAFYPTVALDYGVPLDTRHTYTKFDWEIWCAAIASTETRDMFLSKLVKWINETPATRPFPDLYEAGGGTFPDGGPFFVSRPVMGGNFALLALES